MNFTFILDGNESPSKDEVIETLFDSIAQEELALSNLLSSEANKINSFVGEKCNFPSSPTDWEIIEFNNTAIKIIDSIMMKHWLLLKRIETLFTIQYPNEIETYVKSHSFSNEQEGDLSNE